MNLGMALIYIISGARWEGSGEPTRRRWFGRWKTLSTWHRKIMEQHRFGSPLLGPLLDEAERATVPAKLTPGGRRFRNFMARGEFGPRHEVLPAWGGIIGHRPYIGRERPIPRYQGLPRISGQSARRGSVLLGQGGVSNPYGGHLTRPQADPP